MDGFLRTLDLDGFSWTIGLKGFFQGRVLRVFKDLFCWLFQGSGFWTWFLLDLDFKELGFRQNLLGFEEKEKRKLIDTGFGISLGIGRCWFLWDFGQIDLINQLLM